MIIEKLESDLTQKDSELQLLLAKLTSLHSTLISRTTHIKNLDQKITVFEQLKQFVPPAPLDQITNTTQELTKLKTSLRNKENLIAGLKEKVRGLEVIEGVVREGAENDVRDFKGREKSLEGRARKSDKECSVFGIKVKILCATFVEVCAVLFHGIMMNGVDYVGEINEGLIPPELNGDMLLFARELSRDVR